MAGCSRTMNVPVSAGNFTSPTVTSTASHTPTAPLSTTTTMTPTHTVTSTSTSTTTNTVVGMVMNTATNTATHTATNTATNTVTSTATNTTTATPQTAQATINLNTAANYVILSYTGITNSGPSTTCGGYGTFPDGFTGSPVIVENCGGAVDVGDATADTAEGDLNTAYTATAGRPFGATLPPDADIGGQTLYPGVYAESGNLFIQSADLILNAQGNANAVFIFQVSGHMEIFASRNVILTPPLKASNVYWVVEGSYCALDSYCSMYGIIMAEESITFGTGATLTGRAFALKGDVTLLSNTITQP